MNKYSRHLTVFLHVIFRIPSRLSVKKDELRWTNIHKNSKDYINKYLINLLHFKNENVRLISFLKYSKTPLVAILLGFFYVCTYRWTNRWTLDEQYYFIKDTKDSYVKTQNNMDTLLKGSVRSIESFYFTKNLRVFFLC